MWATYLTPAGPNFPMSKHQPLSLSLSLSLTRTRVPTNVSLLNLNLNLNLDLDKRRLSHQAAAAAEEASNSKQGGGEEEEEEEEEGKEISGSDVLWALQRAAAQAQKKKVKGKNSNKKKKGLTSTEASGGEKDGIGIDYSSVRPLEINKEWSLKLDELEKRLHELERTI